MYRIVNDEELLLFVLLIDIYIYIYTLEVEFAEEFKKT